MISDLYKYIFVHIPKCGGTSIEQNLLQRETELPNIIFEKPYWIDELNEIIQNKFLLGNIEGQSDVRQHYICSKFPEEKRKSYFKFTFVRNPWAKLVSEWLYFKKQENELFENVEFKDCLGSEWTCVDEKLQTYKYIIKAANISDSNNRHPVIFPWAEHSKYQWEFTEGCDYIGKFENLQQDFDIICDKIGIPRQQLPHANNSHNKKHYTEYYDDETREIVARKYARDIKLFGYKFGK